jgi:hypothetical protein
MEFNKNGISLIIPRNNNESDDIYYNRGWFIISQPIIDSINIAKINEINKFANIWINIKFFSCKYPKQLYDKVMSMEKNMLVE